MKLSVSLIFPAVLYEEKNFKEFFNKIAKDYHSTGTLFEGDKSKLHLVFDVIYIENFILDCYFYGSDDIEIQINRLK